MSSGSREPNIAELLVSVTMIAIFSFGCFLGYRYDNWYGVSISGLFLALNIYRLNYHVQKIRLYRALKKDPELKRIYDSWNP